MKVLHIILIILIILYFIYSNNLLFGGLRCPGITDDILTKIQNLKTDQLNT